MIAQSQDSSLGPVKELVFTGNGAWDWWIFGVDCVISVGNNIANEESIQGLLEMLQEFCLLVLYFL